MLMGCVRVVTTVPFGVVCVVCVVWVVVIGDDVATIAVGAAVGAGGGGAETRWDAGSEAQPESSAITPHSPRTGANVKARLTF